MVIDVDADFSSFYGSGGDPDRDCERLYVWHAALWGREVAGVPRLEAEVVASRSGYGMLLRPQTGGEFWVGSDSIVPTWSTPGWLSRFSPELVVEVGQDVGGFFRARSTIGGYVVFPRNRVGETGWTLNQARGMSRFIADRFDLTLECIRRHYDEPAAFNPLAARLTFYEDWFAVFGGFAAFVRFFLLEDLVTANGAVRSLLSGEPLDGFAAPPLPSTVQEYAAYRERSMAFLRSRNARIAELAL